MTNSRRLYEACFHAAVAASHAFIAVFAGRGSGRFRVVVVTRHATPSCCFLVSGGCRDKQKPPSAMRGLSPSNFRLRLWRLAVALMPSSADLCRDGRFSVSSPKTLLLRCQGRRCLRSQRLENLRLRLQPILIRVAAVGRPDVVRARPGAIRAGQLPGWKALAT
jgi:hypothetical protein